MLHYFAPVSGFFLLILGMALLIKGADLLVTGASSLAKRFNVSDLVIGLTVVSFGTSAPELVVNILASFSGNTQIAIGNILGSNVANVLLILGVSAVIYPLTIKKNIILTEIPFSLVAILLIGFLANAALFSGTLVLELSQYDGYIILFFFFLYLLYVLDVAKLEPSEQPTTDTLSAKKSILWVVLGLLSLVLGGKWVVDSAVELAIKLGFSEAFIGLTVIALGTSLPELVTSAMAAFRKNSDIAVGNVIGSNIFNLLWILGLSATIHPLPFEVTSNIDIFIIIAASTLLIMVLVINRNRVSRPAGALFILSYIGYIMFLVSRG